MNNDTDILSELADEKEKKRLEKLEAKKAKKEAKANKKKDKTEDKKDETTDTNEEAIKDNSETQETRDEQSETKDEAALVSGKDKSKKKRKKKKKEDKKPEEINIVKELLSLIIYIGIVILLCYFIINYVGCRSRVDGDSMNETLNDGDNLWVDKLSYTFGEPERFDVIIFNYDEDTTYVKRVIGLPGEAVRIDQSGSIFINENLLVENYGNETILPTNLGRANQPVLLGEDEYFVLGDNRNNSSDSRWPDVGNVSKEDIVGKVVLRIYPFKDFGVIK